MPVKKVSVSFKDNVLETKLYEHIDITNEK